MDDLIAKIKGYLAIINTNTAQIDTNYPNLIEFSIATVLDRVQLYLNSDEIPAKIERILADVVNAGLTKSLKTINGGADRAVNSISDNGQSISYSNEVTRYFSSATDDELFGGFAGLLARYRRVKVVNSK